MGESSAYVHMSAAASLGVNPPAMTELPSPMSPIQPDWRTPSPEPMPPDLSFPISPSQPEIRTSPPLPPLTQAGRPVRNHQLPKRYRPDPLPEPPCPAVQPNNVGAPSLRILPRINLIVWDTFKTILNSFGIWHKYWHRPSYDPDAFVSVADLAQPHHSSHSVESPDLLPDRGY